MLKNIDTVIRKITTDEIRTYLAEYQQRNNCSKVTVDNVRRNISSFFSWLEEEDYILKSPMKRIHKIKTKTVVKNVITDEEIEKASLLCNKYNIELILQPKMDDDILTVSKEKIFEVFNKFLSQYQNIRVIPQVHKFLQIL